MSRKGGRKSWFHSAIVGVEESKEEKRAFKPQDPCGRSSQARTVHVVDVRGRRRLLNGVASAEAAEGEEKGIAPK